MKKAAALLFLLSPMMLANGKPKAYPEHGTVVAIRREGVTHGSITTAANVARIETTTRIYELSKVKREIGSQIDLRIEKGWAYFLDEKGKETKVRVIDEESR